MRCLGLSTLLTVLSVLPVHAAGQATIVETDSGFIVEYTGDASNPATEQAKPEQKITPRGYSDEAKAKMTEVQRQKLAVRETARANQSPSENESPSESQIPASK